MSDNDDRPLPEGWVREFDPKSQHPFWVDTKVKPPRSIWVHPYRDEQFLREHPDIRDRPRSKYAPPPGTPSSASRLTVPERNNGPSDSQPATPVVDQSQSSRGFFGKLKDKAIGTKEEREARRKEEQRQEELRMQKVAEQARLQAAEQARQQAAERAKQQAKQQAAEQARQQAAKQARQQAAEQAKQQAAKQARQQASEQRVSSPQSHCDCDHHHHHHSTGGSYGGSYQPQYGQPVYAAPYGSSYGRTRGSGFGGGGIGLPLLAGAAGGFLLGELFD